MIILHQKGILKSLKISFKQTENDCNTPNQKKTAVTDAFLPTALAKSLMDYPGS